jgi:hypothetical protein
MNVNPSRTVAVPLPASTRPQQNPTMRLARAISEDLCQALIYYQMFAPCALDMPLILRVNGHEIHEGFNVIAEALELGVITILCRIWDKSKHTAQINEVARRLKKNPGQVSDQAQLPQWWADVDKIQNSDELKALRGYRNTALAHRHDPNRPDPRAKSGTRRVLNGDCRFVLEATIPIVERLDSLVGVTYTDLNWQRQNWEQSAGKFWDAIARAR